MPDRSTLARRLLRQAGQGRVLVSCTGAMYLRTDGGEILWIQGRDAPMHRRAVELSAATVPSVAAGVPFRVERETLRVGSSISIDLQRASLWEPEPVQPTVAAGSEELASRIRELFGTIDTARARELGTLIPFLRRLFEGHSDVPAKTGDPVLDAASPHAIGAARACRARNPAVLEAHARALVGLGRGLTPSGDDFIGGLLFVLRRVPGICPVPFSDDACSTARGWADRTNAISFAILGDHGAGHGNAVEHEIVSSLRGASPGPGRVRQSSVSCASGTHRDGTISRGWSPRCRRFGKAHERRTHGRQGDDKDGERGEAVRRLGAGDPVLVDIAPAGEVIPGMRDRMITHSGPPVSWKGMCGAQRGAVIATVLFERWAATVDEAIRMLDAGGIDLEPNHHHQTVGPMAGTISRSSPVWVVENRAFGNRAFCRQVEG